MRKFTLLMLLAFLLPCFSAGMKAADNMAIKVSNGSGRNAYRIEVDESALLDRQNGDYAGSASEKWPYFQKSFTMTGWYKVVSFNNGGNVLLGHQPRCHVNYNGAFYVAVNNAGKVTMGGKYNTGSGQSEHRDHFTSDKVIAADTWVNVALVYDVDASTISVYIDGELAGTRELEAKLTAFPDSPGVITFGSTNCNSWVDEAALFDGVLTAEQIKTAMNDAKSLNPLCFYTFDETNGTDGEYANEGSLDYPAKLIQATSSGYGSNGEITSAYSFVSIAAETVEGRELSQAVETHTLTINTNGQGAVTITDGTNTYASGDAIPATADLALTFAPAEGWTLASAVFAGGDYDGVDLVAYEAIEDGTFVLGNLTTDLTLNVTFEQAPVATYCTIDESVKSTNTLSSYVSEIFVKAGDETQNINNLQTGDRQKIYWDKTENVINLEAGKEVSCWVNTARAHWGHLYMWIDYNNDKEFTARLDESTHQPLANSEFVAYGNLGFNNNTVWMNSNGETYSDGSKTLGFKEETPLTFTVPSDLAPGDYRARVIMGYNEPTACPDINRSNDPITAIGGIVVDFTLRIEEPTVNTERLTVEVVGEGSVRVVGDNDVEYDPAGADIPWGVVVKMFATPAAGWSLKSVDVGGEDAQPAEDGSYLNMEIIMNCNVIVTFEENDPNPIYIYQPTNNGGTLTVFNGDKELQDREYVPEGAELRAVATPKAGFEFSKFKHNNADVPAEKVTIDETGVATYVLEMPNTMLSLEALFTEASGPVPPAEYCHPEGNANSKNTPKGIEKITVTDDKGNSVEVAGSGTGKTHALYTDATDQVLITEPGATIKIQNYGEGSWMSTYVYIDYNGNGTFDFDADKCDENIVGTTGPNVDGELVAHTGYNTAKHATNADTADPTVACDGTKLSGTTYNWNTSFKNAVPAFTLPEDLKPGDYRIRHKMDWNSVNPCGRVTSADLVGLQGGNFMGENGGGIIDFTIRIEAQEPRAITVVSAQPELGSVAIIEPETAGNTVTVEGPVTIKATATDEDAYFVNWTNAAGDVVSTEAEYTYGKGEEATFTANFRQHYLLTVVDAENGTTVKAGTTVVESGEYVDKGTMLTVTCSVEEKILKSLMINEVEKVAEYVATGYVFTMNEATSIEVEFAMPVYEVGELAVEGEGTLVVAEGVTAEGAPSGATFAEGAELEKGSEPMVIATPAANYKIESMIVDGFAVVTDGEPMEEDEYVSTYADGLIVAYQAYIEGSLKASVKFVKSNNSAIESIGADEADDAEFFNLQGISVSRENMTPGIYIMRNAEGARKVSVK